MRVYLQASNLRSASVSSALMQSPMAATLLGVAALALIAPFVLKNLQRFKTSED